MMKRQVVHVWVPGCAPESGGVQAFSAALVRGICEAFPMLDVRVFSKHDGVRPEGLPLGCQWAAYGSCSGRWRTLRYAWSVVWAGLVRRPDLIVTSHVNFTPLARWMKRLWGVRYVAVAHGIDVWGLKHRGVIRGIMEAERVFAVSRYTRDKMMEELGLDGGQCELLPNTVSAEGFVMGGKPEGLVRRFGLTEEQPVLLTVSRLAGKERYKGYESVIQVLPKLRERLPGLRYVLAGKGDDRARVERLIAEAGVGDMVTLAGFVPAEELNDFYNLCDVFVMPSKGEGFGIVFLEALVCGKVVIAGNVDGSVDPLHDGEFGRLIDPDDLRALEEAIFEGMQEARGGMMNKEDLRAKVLARFGFEAFRERIKILLGTILGI